MMAERLRAPEQGALEFEEVLVPLTEASGVPELGKYHLFKTQCLGR